ncbi:hypothetical protein Hanom_Chr03g00197961 [Helianthus anomalus]
MTNISVFYVDYHVMFYIHSSTMVCLMFLWTVRAGYCVLVIFTLLFVGKMDFVAEFATYWCCGKARPHTRHNPPSYENPTSSFFSIHRVLDRKREICRKRVAATVSHANWAMVVFSRGNDICELKWVYGENFAAHLGVYKEPKLSLKVSSMHILFIRLCFSYNTSAFLF